MPWKKSAAIVVLSGLIALLPAFCSFSSGPPEEVTHAKEEKHVTAVQERFILIARERDKVRFRSDGSIIKSVPGRTSPSGSSSEFVVGVGDSFQDAPDHHAWRTYTIRDIGPNEVRVSYESGFDHRSFGKDLITIDRGVASWPYRTKSESPAELHSRQARDFYARSDLAKALASFAQALKLQPNAQLYFERGCVYRDIAQAEPSPPEKAAAFTKAINDFTAALSMEPRFVSALLERARIYEELKAYEQAAADYGSAHSYENRARVYYLLGRYDQSWADVRKQRSIGPVSKELVTKLKQATGREE